MKHARRPLVLFLWVLSALSAEAAALTGRVRDGNTNSFLPGATVVLRAPAREATTDRDGVFSLGQLPPGAYTVTVSYLGYAEASETVTIASEGDRSVEIALQADIVKLGRFVVGGEREGQARALQQKRTADNIIDVVSADSAGKLPDGNAAEAVRRLPGVFAEIDQNEGRYIVVRGIDAALNNITIDGISVGSTESGTRGSAMDSVPADLISRIEVVKAVTPDMDHQAVGASVNIVTPSAFDRGRALRLRHGRRRRVQRPEDRPADPQRRHLRPDLRRRQVGAHRRRELQVPSLHLQPPVGRQPLVAGGTGRHAGGGIFFPAVDALFHYDVQRWRQGVNAALEYRPAAPPLRAAVSDNRFKDEEGREQSNFEFFRTAFPASFTPTTATFTGGRATVEYRYYRQKHNITNTSFTGKHNLGDGRLRLDYLVAVGEANKQTPDRQDWEFRSGTNLTSTVNTSAFHWDLEPGAAYFDAASYPFRRVRFRRDEEEEDNLNGDQPAPDPPALRPRGLRAGRGALLHPRQGLEPRQRELPRRHGRECSSASASPASPNPPSRCSAAIARWRRRSTSRRHAGLLPRQPALLRLQPRRADPGLGRHRFRDAGEGRGRLRRWPGRTSAAGPCSRACASNATPATSR
jgi:hypothetical protein